jgi:CheY-like chemotaxis protein
MLSRQLSPARTVVANQLEQAAQAARQIVPQTVIIDSTDEPYDVGKLRALADAWGLTDARMVACTLPGEELLRLRLAADGYLIKPVTRDQLLYTLNPFAAETARILIVDDDRDFARLLERMLTQQTMTYQVKAAEDGTEALSLMESYRPDVLLLDLEMPGMGGAEVLERIRAREEWAHIKVIIVSAQDQPDESALSLGGVVATYPGRPHVSETLRWIRFFAAPGEP